MPTIDDIRRRNLATLITEAGGNKAFAELLGVSESQLSQWAKGSANSATGKPRGMRVETAQRLERAGGKPQGWLDQDRDRSDGVVNPAPQALVFDDTLRHLLQLPALSWLELAGREMITTETMVVVGTRELAPDVTVGDRIHIDPTAPVEPGRLVLCRDQAGIWHLRRVQDLGSGRWQAVAADGATWAPIPQAELTAVVRVVGVYKAV